jgi:8-oxo-dGTP pyrophosphatase MutT (NUDIX family)
VSRRNPWKTLSSRILVENPWFRVRQDQVIRPDGEPGTYNTVMAANAVGVVPCFPDGSILLVGQYRYPISRYSWEIPEGGGERDERPLQTARRELREETGYRAQNFRSLGVFHTSNCFTDEKAFLYYATGLTPGESSQDATEQIVTRRVPFEDAYRMASSGEITDGMTIVALFRNKAGGLAPWS